MDLDETWQVGLRPEKAKPCTFPAKLRHRFRREREKMGCKMWRVWRTTSATFLDWFPPNFPQTCVQVLAHDTWFHIAEKFPLWGRISWKTVFFRVQKGTLFVMRLWVTGNVLRRRISFHPWLDIPQIYPSWVTFAEGYSVFHLSTSARLRILGHGTSNSNLFQTYSPGGATIGSMICTNIACAMHTTL